MATSIRNIGDLKSEQAIVSLNQLRLDLMQLKLGKIWHADATPAVTAATATDTPTAVVMANALKTSYTAHIASAIDATSGQGCHIAADATNTITAATATDTTTVVALANDIKSKYEAHRASTTFHPQADATNTITAANATDSPTAVTLVNDLKAKINAHFAGAFTHQATLRVSP